MANLKFIRFIFFLLVTDIVYCQESSQYTLFMGHKYALNPAYAGLESSLSITGSVRSQWQELPGAPSSKIIHANLPLYYLKGAGGLKLEQESFGVEKTIRALATYNYVQETPIGIFSAGFGLGIIQKSLDGAILRTPQGRYEGTVIQHNDPTLFNSVLNGITPQMSAGLYFAQDKLEVGLSIENFHRPKLNFERGSAYYQVSPRVNLYGEYRIDLQEALSITPAFLVKSDLLKFQVDINALATINEKIYAGAGFRGYSQKTFDAITFVGGLQINPNLKVYYGFDLTLSNIRSVQQGTHELLINYNLRKAIGGIEKEPIIYNPRY